MAIIIEQLHILSSLCDADAKELIENMIRNAADYVQAVIWMETAAANFAGREGDELRSAVAELDKSRSTVHNALISSVNIVNRICDMYGQPPIYFGGEERRRYGDFAMDLIEEIFENRN